MSTKYLKKLWMRFCVKIYTVTRTRKFFWKVKFTARSTNYLKMLWVDLNEILSADIF